MTKDIYAAIGAFTVYFILSFLGVFLLLKIAQIKPIMKGFSSVAHILYRKKKSAELYESLARNGYIYKWASRFLIRYKAKK